MGNNKLRVLFVSPTAVLGGAERIMFNTAMYLLMNGHHVTVYIMSRGEQDGWDALRDYRNFSFIVKGYPSEKTSLPMFFFSMIQLTWSHSFDYIFSSHTHVNAALSSMRYFGLLKCKYLISRESTFIFDRYFGVKKWIFWMLYRYFYGAQDLLICQTGKMRESLIRSLGFQPVRMIEVMANPVNIEHIDTMKADVLIESIPFDRIVMGCGRLIKIKRFDLLIQAFSLVANDFPEFGLVIVGDGPERIFLEKLVNELGIASRVIFTGRQNNPIKWFAAADLGVISSEIEGFPNVLIEMLASGTKFVISTPCTDGVVGIPDIDVLDECSVVALESAFRKRMNDRVNFSYSYRKYIEEKRSVGAFWHQIELLVSR